MDAPYLNCDGCRTTLGRAGCPTHRQNASATIAPSVQWSSSEPVLTHCRHGLDLRTHPRCYLCSPDNERLADVRMALVLIINECVPPTDRYTIERIQSLAHDGLAAIAKAYLEDTDASK